MADRRFLLRTVLTGGRAGIMNGDRSTSLESGGMNGPLSIEVTGLSRTDSQKPNKGGSRKLAYFDCRVGPFILTGCVFVRTARNGLAVWPPKLDLPGRNARGIRIDDPQLLHLMTLQAQAAYRQMGGTDAEWIRSGESNPKSALEAQIEATSTLGDNHV